MVSVMIIGWTRSRATPNPLTRLIKVVMASVGRIANTPV